MMLGEAGARSTTSKTENWFYSVVYGSPVGSGVRVLVLCDGVITGADGGGNLYDGHYFEDEQTETIKFHVDVTIPAHMPMVIGIAARPDSWKFSMDGDLPPGFARGLPIIIRTGTTPVSVSFRSLRKLDSLLGSTG
jgi:hypothetical protein